MNRFPLLLLAATATAFQAGTSPSPPLHALNFPRERQSHVVCNPMLFRNRRRRFGPAAMSPLRVSLLPEPVQDTSQDIATTNRDMEDQQAPEQWVDESKHVETLGLLAWGLSVSAFILVNNFVGPWPESLLHSVPERIWFLGHMLGGMLFGGGIIMTTAIEYLVAETKNIPVLQFWFDKVPQLDMALVLPGLTLSMISGTGLTTVRYGGLGSAPPHIPIVFWALIVFAAWWAVTDLTTQGKAFNSVLALSTNERDKIQQLPPKEVSDRLVSNVVSCFLVFAIFAIMVLKPGTLSW